MGPILMGTHVASVSRHVLPYMDVLHCEYARQGCSPFKRVSVSGWTLSMQRLDAWISFL
jgi:hypothetical protein